MNYFNWQKIHRDAFTAKTKAGYKAASQLNPEPMPSIESIHSRAWDRLSRICSRTELEKLEKLAEQYSKGERMHDTFYIL
jgi:hypothetical protein